MIVYRFHSETSELIGPYVHLHPEWLRDDSTSLCWDFMSLGSSTIARQPIPSDDGLPLLTTDMRDNLFCGFTGPEQIISWYGTLHHFLARKSTWLLSAFEVPDDDCWVGNCQIVFRMDRAEFLGSILEWTPLEKEN